MTYKSDNQAQLKALHAAVAAGPPDYDPDEDSSLSPVPDVCPTCNGTGEVTRTSFYTLEQTTHPCPALLNHPKEAS